MNCLVLPKDSIFQILSNKIVLDLKDLQDKRVQSILFPAGQPLCCLISHVIQHEQKTFQWPVHQSILFFVFHSSSTTLVNWRCYDCFLLMILQPILHLVHFIKQVAVIAPNIPAIYEAHFGVPMAGAVVNCVNIRLNASTVAFLLDHSAAAVVMVDQEFFPLAEEGLRIIREKHKENYKPPIFIVIGDENCDPQMLDVAIAKGAVEYEEFLKEGDPDFAWSPPKDEWQSITLGYTSGTTSSPKGVVLHHRGAYLMSLSGALIWGLNEGAIYLWTLPMFHCNGWCYAWSLAALCGTSICLRQVPH